jgi:acetylglutamate kinase
MPYIPDHLLGQIAKATTLIEALPYLQRFRGQTFLIKFGGSAMDDPDLVKGLLADIVFLELAGINPVVVHGGGKAITKAMEEAGLQARFVNGLRVTDAATIRIVEQTLSRVINPSLVKDMYAKGGRAVGFNGTTVFKGRKTAPATLPDGSIVDYGFVGEVTDFDITEVQAAISREEVPVISPVASEIGTGQPLNVNADVAAASLAGRLKAVKFLYLSDVLGVMRDPKDNSSLIPSITAAGVQQLKEEGIITGGMIPKVDSALQALAAGVEKVHLIDGRLPHSLLLEIFTKGGIGTEIRQG